MKTNNIKGWLDLIQLNNDKIKVVYEGSSLR